MKAIIVLILMVFSSALYAQWATSGNNIYNTNTGNVGIGVSSPSVKLEVNGGGSTDVFNLLNESNSMGINAQVSSSTSFHASAVTGKRSRGTLASPADVSSGDRLTGWYSGMFVNGAFRNSAAIQFYAGSTPSSSSYPANIRFETTANGSTTRTERMRVTESGDVGIGFTAPSAKLDVNGSVRATSFITISDERFKSNIKPVQNSLEQLSKIDGVTYQFKSGNFPERQFPAGEKIGLIAQQVRGVFPNSVSEDSNGYLAVDYLSLIPVMIESIKELNSQLTNSRELMLSKFVIDEDKEGLTITSGFTLKQNTPNPFNKTTVIEYGIPNNVQSASILIHNLSGQEIKRYDLSKGGNGKVEIAEGDIANGFYLYTLIANGVRISTKKMILTK